ncbi:excalibur calcium-binding domain-containing protein [Streptomyces sp. NPDC086080]|uniref:excalibur calcium-binding domain-containing protein n=1 Tax=Streptomyces sp. NPDC086080 TaxID=3365748 RepID=UPI0037CF38F0
MHPIRSFATVLAALAVAALPTAAMAHDGDHPFASCSDAYANGYSSISGGDDHYGPHLDDDGDGIACDQPPADFTPRDITEIGDDTTAVTDTSTAAQDDDLAETGAGKSDSDNNTYLVVIGVSVVVIAGGTALVIALARRS